jgi:hypothetical protein
MSMHSIIRTLARGRVVVGLVGLAIGLPAGLGPNHAGAALPRAWHAGADTVIWRATLKPPEVPAPAGTATVGGAATLKVFGKRTHADIHVANAKPGSVLPWHVHKGTCGHDQGIVGPPKAYVPIHIGVDGGGEVAVTLPFALPTKGQHMVNVHASASDLKTIVACGELQKE